MQPLECDVLIVGGGPAGLSAALVLGRACKRVVICDAGAPRNAAAREMHGFVSRDGIAPAAFRAVAHAELAVYDVTIRTARVVGLERDGDGWRAALDDGAVRAARVVIATGMIDEHPAIPGYAEKFGASIHLCPYCHGWELRGARVGVLVDHPLLLEFALLLRGWSDDLVVIADPALAIDAEMSGRLAAAGVGVVRGEVRALLGDGPKLAAVELADGSRLERDALFVKPRQRQTELVRGLGLALDDAGYVRVDEMGATSVAGIFACGDLCTMRQGALVAAAAGAMVSYGLNHALTVGAGIRFGGGRATPPA